MSAVIFKSKLPLSKIPLSWKLGIDIKMEDLDEREPVMRGDLCCTYDGKVVPCIYGMFSKAIITSTLLAEMLEFIDDCGIFNRSIAKSFLLFDGHVSRIMLPFLKYIDDPEHGWVCCMGVPCATHIWQVGDVNGTLKIALTKAKREYIKHRKKPGFDPTDSVPLLNRAWESSFNNASSVI